MNFLTKMGFSIFQGLSLLFVLGFLLGILNLHFSDKNDYCAMTYMFEYPQFVRISVPENDLYPQYGLYAYSEGRYTERARRMWFDGVPVLFLPGNSGSHMQARSLASVALRKALSKNYEYHFDFYTISYNEELSGIYGGVLQSQTKFAAACILKILSLYKSNRYTKSVPSSVIIIGHSMGGLIAKRLMAYPSTLDKTTIAITLAAPLQAPVINTDLAMNDFYKLMEFEWDMYINNNEVVKHKKMMISFGNGPRDLLMPSSLIYSNDSYINALSTAVPGVWVSPDHVSIVWCKQLVMAINKFLFAIVDPLTGQIKEDRQIWMSKARQFFQANRSIFLNPDLPHGNMTMLGDAFWYEDSRRIYQISRPEIDRMTYLMIRLVTFPQNRFVAIEAVNVDDKDWIFGCNAMHVYGTYRYCKHATALSELSRWTGSATGFGKRKLATIHLHSIKDAYPDWSHVVVKVSPTRKPIILNVDVNDHASRVINVNLPSEFSFGKTVIKEETEQNSLYYELLLPGFNTVHQAYLLYVEPTADCKASQYHVSAELHVPWTKNYEYSHFYTHIKRSPMKLRLYMSNPNITTGGEPSEPAKVTLLLDPQCSYSISISQSWYLRLAQLARNYTTVLVPYVAAIILLAARSNLLSLREKGSCISIHSALMSEGVKPYYALVFARLGAMVFMSIPMLSFLFENASWENKELQYFTHSLLVLPAYMTALGILNIGAAALIAVMVFSSQLAHRLLFRIIWRGGPAFAEKVASGLQKVPMVVSATLICAVPLSCGAASLAAGAAFYAFMISKMYEEYLEDYVYKLMAKVASKLCRMFKSKKHSSNESQTHEETNALVTKCDVSTVDTMKDDDKNYAQKKPDDENSNNAIEGIDDSKEKVVSKTNEKADLNTDSKCSKKSKRRSDDKNLDEDLNNLNFHVMMFFLWVCVTLVNVPALLTWARNFKFSMVLKPDTSYHTGMILSACSACIWQMEGPRPKLRHYEAVAALLFTMSVFILALGPLSLTIVNYGITFMFAIITLQQLCDKEEFVTETEVTTADDESRDKNVESRGENEGSENEGDPNKGKGSVEVNKSSDEENVKSSKDNKPSEKQNSQDEESKESKNSNEAETKKLTEDCDVCSENQIYGVFKRLRDKFSFSEDS